MATIAHVSHYGLTQLPTNKNYIRFQGTMGNCKRLAAAHGLEWQEGFWQSPISNQRYARYTLTPLSVKVGVIMDLRREDKRVDQHQIWFTQAVWENE